MKFRKAFLGVPAGEIYPVAWEKGDECPPELEAAAIASGAVKAPKAKPGGETGGEGDDGADDEGEELVLLDEDDAGDDLDGEGGGA